MKQKREDTGVELYGFQQHLAKLQLALEKSQVGGLSDSSKGGRQHLWQTWHTKAVADAWGRRVMHDSALAVEQQ